jgi:surface antigen
MPFPAPRRLVTLLLAIVVAATIAPLPAQAAHTVSKHGTSKAKKKSKKAKKKVRTVHVKVVLGASAGGRGGDPGDDYPSQWKNAPQDSLFDNWREYNRECTSFAAWALASRNGFNMPFHDDAGRWGDRARALGYHVDGRPAVGSIAWSDTGRYGHVAYVVDVSGGTVTIEEYNHDGHGRYSRRAVPASAFTGYIHFADVTPPAAAPAPASPGGIQGGQVPIQGGSGAPVQGGSPTPIQGSAPPLQGADGGGGSGAPAPAPAPAPGPAPRYYAEQQGHLGVNTFTNPYNASGMGARIGAAQTVEVSCRVYAPQIASANPDGWWYRIHASPWSDAYYSPANTFMNGDPWNGPYTHNTDFSVPVC